MIEDPRQIADDLQTLEKAMGSFSEHLAEYSFDTEYVRTRLGDFSQVLSALRQRVLSLPYEQTQSEEKNRNES